MKNVVEGTTVLRRPAKLGAAVLVGGLAVLLGCPMVPPVDDGDDDGGAGAPGPGTVTASIVSPTIGFGVSLADLPVAVRYTVTGEPSDISGFYVPVADNTPGSAAIGDRVIIASGLQAGSNQFFNFQVDRVGFFRVGVIATADSRQEVAESRAVIQVEGPPDPRFILPSDALTVVNRGQDVEVRFDAGDPENRVQWRLFFLREGAARDAPPHQLGMQLAVGAGNIGTFTWSTSALEAGNYELGVSATDSGASVATTAEAGELARIVTVPGPGERGPIVRVVEGDEAQPPTLSFNSPGAEDVTLFRDQSFSIEVVAEVREPGASGRIEVFRDNDRDATNGFVPIATRTVEPGEPRTLAFALPTTLPEGTYNVGAQITDSINDPVVRFAEGSVVVVRDVTLAVTQPAGALPVRPGESVPVRWDTNAPASSGTVDVFAQRVDPATLLPFGSEIPILTGGAMTTTSASFVSNQTGLFAMSVRLNITDGTFVQERAPANVRVSTLPRMLWLGSLADAQPAFEGAIFGGVNFEDNAGTSLASVGDMDGDGNDDFVIAARYGKPFFQNPEGISRGEAYLLYGANGTEKLRGDYNLNSTGTESLRGITFTGIRTVDNSSDTDGLAAVTLLPDVDGDEKGELAFGFPRTNSAGGASGPLEREGQFLNGGVVILSSKNSLLSNPPTGGSVIDLGRVGQRFSNTGVPEATVELVLEDRLTFDEESGQCVPGTDGVPDTIVGPSTGFVSSLAPPAWEQLGFEIITGTPAPDRCPTQFDVAACVGPDANPFSGQDAGSGFYATSATLLEPVGARLIGPAPGDRFGASITTSKALDDDTPGDLVISAPGRSAEPGFVNGITSSISGSGVAFLADFRNFWEPDSVFLNNEPPPSPRQYLMGFVGHCGGGRAQSVAALRIAGNIGDRIEVMLGVPDINGDGRNDFAVGAPNANGGQGRVYIAFRREEVIEGDFVLPKLGSDPSDRERLAGLLITSNSLDGLGSSFATDVDFNGDEVPDLVFSSPNADTGVGEVLILFGASDIISPANGITVEALLERRTEGVPVAARIRGNPLDTQGRFGFNVANAGDLDGDGTNDLLIAAPGASPRFDPDPNDGVDELTELGVDLDSDGEPDDVPGPDDTLSQAGIVYVIYGRTRLDRIRTCSGSGIHCLDDGDCGEGEACALAPDTTINITQLGSTQLDGFMILGRRAGDRIGGGDAGDPAQGGNSAKSGRGRSFGLTAAGDVDADGRGDILIGSVLADPRRDPITDRGVQNGGEAYLIYGTAAP